MYYFSLMNKGSIHSHEGKIIPKKDAEQLISADEILTLAREEAKEIIKAAENEALEIKKKAEEAGFHEGLVQFNSQLLYFEERVKVLRHEMQKVVLPLVLKATKRIVGDELELNPQSVVDIVVHAIKAVAGAKTIKLYVNRHDLDALESNKNKLKAIFENLENFTIEERPDVTRGGCIIETERGILNATLENQYRALERAFETYTKKR